MSNRPAADEVRTHNVMVTIGFVVLMAWCVFLVSMSSSCGWSWRFWE